jgi:hypothetical protein
MANEALARWRESSYSRDLQLDCWKPKRSPPLHAKAWHAKDENSYRLIGVPSSPRATRVDNLERAVLDSRALLDLPPDWDDEGAQQIQQSTWDSAIGILRHAARFASRLVARAFDPPKIAPCSDGSIDLYWSTPNFTLLINIKAGGTLADYYGERPDTEVKIQALLNPSAPDFDFLRLLVKP